jgi:seryl-tRNA synthetase
MIADLKKFKEERDALLAQIGNLLHESVIVSNDKSDNYIERTFGNVKAKKRYSYIDLLVMIDGFDGYFLKGPLVFLQQALISLALQILSAKEFIPLYSQLFINKEMMRNVAEHFDEWLSPSLLPIKYAEISTGFKPKMDMFRINQFVICSPEADISWKYFDEVSLR